MLPREKQLDFCVRTGREPIAMGADRTEDRMRNVNAWYTDLDVDE